MIIPALFISAYESSGGGSDWFGPLNVMRLESPESAILSAIIFNALIIVALIPLALRGVAYRPMNAAALLRRNLFLYGLGGIIAPFAGIKAIDLALTAVGLSWAERTVLTPNPLSWERGLGVRTVRERSR